jgi:hypothetical protein
MKIANFRQLSKQNPTVFGKFLTHCHDEAGILSRLERREEGSLEKIVKAVVSPPHANK